MKSVRILSYNVFLRPPCISSDCNGDFKDERLDLIISSVLPAYDVVCLQEIFTRFNWRREKLIEAAKKLGYQYFSIPPDQPMKSLYFVNSGLLTLSKYPIADTSFLPFDHGSGVDRLAFKGILYSRLEIDPGSFLNLFNVHLQSHYHAADFANIVSRLKQIHQLKKHVELCLKTFTKIERRAQLSLEFNEPVYLIGDFNVCANRNRFSKQSVAAFKTRKRTAFDLFLDGQPDEEPLFKEYSFLLHTLKQPFSFAKESNKVRDLLKERYGHHPVTFLDDIGSDRSSRSLELERSGDSMDFVFELVPPHQNAARVQLVAEAGDASVQPFAVDNKNFTYLSDHLGVDFTIRTANNQKL